ncbi:SRPBCC family protein [Leucobacter sp. CSA2]|uniref:SRPBCC family protein n=1 Tax=Leucobacter edaphi TaxID=2796472 RepID=A0A934QC72_9MICO|nr:SRPBCC family protein [Leucobacter edaphi]MBK0421976.1 SRPBCC family protein [Leucobacter edaphi]
MTEETKIVSVERVVAAPAEAIFELIADPAQQPRWDGNDNLAEAAPGQRVRAVGDVFVMTNTGDRVRENRIVEFEEGRRIAWMPNPPGEPAPGHLWRWELEPQEGGTLVRHTYDWSGLTDESRFDRARQFTADALRASVDRLAELAEREAA